MSWNGAGVYSRGYPSWTADAAANLPISATKFDTEDNDFAGGINNCLTKDGQNSPTAALTWTIANAVALTLLRQTDGTVFSVGRSGGANNPALQFQVTDGVGATINLNTPQTLALAINSNAALSIANTGAVAVLTPQSIATALTVNGFANANALSVLGSSTSGQSYGLNIGAGSTSVDYAVLVRNQAGGATFLQVFGDGHGTLGPSAALGLSWSSIGNVVVSAPSAGAALTINDTVAGVTPLQISMSSAANDAVVISDSAGGGRTLRMGPGTGGGAGGLVGFYDNVAATLRLGIGATGTVTINLPSSGNLTTLNNNGTQYALSCSTASAQSAVLSMVCAGVSWFQYIGNNNTNALSWNFNGGNDLFRLDATTGTVQAPNGSVAAGLGPIYAGVPQNLQAGATYQLILSDANKHIFLTNSTTAVTIPANASVAFPIGTAVTFVSNGSGSSTIAITTDTLVWAATGGTGTRTLAAKGMATALKVSATAWWISGTGLS